ncbi:hypothetical protein Tco_0114801 [Tanacetum coccineum]
MIAHSNIAQLSLESVAIFSFATTQLIEECVEGEKELRIEPTSIAKALSNSSWVKAMQEELLQFKLQRVWILVDLPIGKRAIGTK